MAARIRRHRRDDAVHGLQAAEQRIGGIEKRQLVFLVVAVVGQRLALHQHQQRVQIADHAAGLAAHQFSGTSGFFFCGMMLEPVQ